MLDYDEESILVKTEMEDKDGSIYDATIGLNRKLIASTVHRSDIAKPNAGQTAAVEGSKKKVIEKP